MWALEVNRGALVIGPGLVALERPEGAPDDWARSTGWRKIARMRRAKLSA